MICTFYKLLCWSSAVLCYIAKNDIVTLARTFVIYVVRPCKLYSHMLQLLSSQPFWAEIVDQMTKKCCDYALHEREAWTKLHRCNSHDQVFVKRTNLLLQSIPV